MSSPPKFEPKKESSQASALFVNKPAILPPTAPATPGSLLSTSAPGRLGSLRPSPDLTLGGVQRAKFTPNISVQRKKGQTFEPEKNYEKPQRADHRGPKPERPRDRGPFKQPFVPKFPRGPIAPITGGSGSGSGSGAPGMAAARDTSMSPPPPRAASASPPPPSDEKMQEVVPEVKKKRDTMDNWPADMVMYPTSLSSILSEGYVDSDEETEQHYQPISAANVASAEEESVLQSVFTDSMRDQRLIPEDKLFFFQLPSSLPTSVLAPPKPQPQASTPAASPNPGTSAAAAGKQPANSAFSPIVGGGATNLPTPLPPAKPEDASNAAAAPRVMRGSYLEMQEIWTTESTNTFTQLPAGYIGKLQIMKSGKVRLRLGDAIFDVIPAADASFSQHVSVIYPETQQCYVLGDISKRVLCIPDVEHLLEVEERLQQEQKEARAAKVQSKAPAGSSS